MAVMPDALATPVAWNVHAVDGRKDYVDGCRPDPSVWRFGSQADAERKKLDCQRAGMVATITPVYLTGYERRKAGEAAQLAPFGPFNADWSLAP
jgi:hypothetical protein